MNFDEELSVKVGELTSRKHFLKRGETPPVCMSDSYSLEAGGKRLRPVLLLSLRFFKSRDPAAALALELFMATV